MKVCILRLHTSFIYASRIKRQVKTLVNQGHEVHVFHVYDPVFNERFYNVSSDKDLLYNEDYAGAYVHMVKAAGFPPFCATSHLFSSYLGQYKELLIHLSRHNFDVYHCSNINALLIGYLAAKKNAAKLVYDSSEYWQGILEAATKNSAYSYSPEIARSILEFEKLAVARVDYIITVGDIIADKLKKGLAFEKIVVIRNIIDYHKPSDSRELRQMLGVNDDIPVLLYLGMLGRGRGIEKIIDVAERIPEIVFALVGFGPLKDSLLLEIKQKGLENRVKILPAVPYEKIVDFASSADMGIHLVQPTSLNNYYCLPNKLFEYMMAGLPVGFSDFPEVGKIIKENQIGITFNPEDTNNISESIREFIFDRNKVERARNNARRLAGEVFNWQIEEKKLISIYEELEKGLAKKI